MVQSSALQLPTLILNKSWYPIDSTTVKEAFTDVISGRAVFLDALSDRSLFSEKEDDFSRHDICGWMDLEAPEDAPHIRTPTHRIRVPEIMLLTEYKKIPKRTVVFNRRNLWRRDGMRCQYCGTEPPYDEITVDHIKPKSKGGLTTFSNCVLCCLKCNLRKADRTLEAAGMHLQRRKRTQNGEWTVVHYETPNHPVWNPLYALSRRTYPKSWAGFLKDFDATLYWEVELLED